MPPEHAWLDTILDPAVLVDVRGMVVAWNGHAQRAFSSLRDLPTNLGRVTRRVLSDGEPVRHEGLDTLGRSWVVAAEPSTGGMVLLRFVPVEDAFTDPGPVDDEAEEITAEIFQFDRTDARIDPRAAARAVQVAVAGQEAQEEEEEDDEDEPTVLFEGSSRVAWTPPSAALQEPELPPALAGANAPCLLVRRGMVLDANDAASVWCGVRGARQLIGRHLTELAPVELDTGDDAAHAVVSAERAARERGRHAFAWAFRSATGVVPVEAAFSEWEREADLWLLTWTPRAPEAEGAEVVRSKERLALALARSIRPLLVRDDIDIAIREALTAIGSAIAADRCFLLLIEREAGSDRALNGRRYVWAADGIPEQPHPPRPGAETGVVPPRWERVLSTGGQLLGRRDAFPPSERAILDRYGVKSVAIVPIRVEGRLVGFMGLDACESARDWPATEVEILAGMADSFAGALRQRDASRALRGSRDRYETAVHGADLAVWELDIPTGRICHADGVTRVLGPIGAFPRTLDEINELLHPDNREGLRAVATEHAARRVDLVDVELRVRAANHAYKWVLLRGRISKRGTDGEPLRAHGTVLDIDERKRLSTELKQAKETAERASEAKSRFLANMSHEIRTPLNAVLGMAALLQGTRLNRHQVDLVSTLKGSGEHLLALLNQVLDVSRIESGELELAETPFDLRGTVFEVGELYRATAETRGLGLEVRLDERLPSMVRGDATRLRQVIVNLVDNAIKFTEEGGVTLMAWCPEPADPHRVRIEVSDTGIGIQAEQIGSLFDAFNQADGSDARRHGGTGLGLAISRHLCASMGGTLDAESEPGCGSVFRFDITFGEVDEADLPANQETEIELRLPDDLQILVVEDNAVNQKVAVGMLNRLGCDPRVSDNGVEALETLRSGLPEVVLMDIQMPGMDGLETTRRIRAAGGSGTNPWIIAVTAAAQDEDRQRSMASGMNDYLAKPVRLGELQEALRRAVKVVRAG